MTTTYDRVEACLSAGNADDVPALLAALVDDAWTVRYAAAIALGDRPDPRALEPLLAILAHEDTMPLYGQPEDFGGIPAGANTQFHIDFPADASEETREAWRRRGRLKQAVCLALGQLGSADPRVLAALGRYTVTADEDYAVRAAACKALGLIGDPQALPVLEQAANDPEWCTMTEARKAVARVRKKG